MLHRDGDPLVAFKNERRIPFNRLGLVATSDMLSEIAPSRRFSVGTPGQADMLAGLAAELVRIAHSHVTDFGHRCGSMKSIV
jgi:hypothetical protein